jgi:hypothetical protein
VVAHVKQQSYMSVIWGFSNKTVVFVLSDHTRNIFKIWSKFSLVVFSKAFLDKSF